MAGMVRIPDRRARSCRTCGSSTSHDMDVHPGTRSLHGQELLGRRARAPARRKRRLHRGLRCVPRGSLVRGLPARPPRSSTARSPPSPFDTTSSSSLATQPASATSATCASRIGAERAVGVTVRAARRARSMLGLQRSPFRTVRFARPSSARTISRCEASFGSNTRSSATNMDPSGATSIRSQPTNTSLTSP